MESPYTIQQIMEYLPHRYPFLLIDRILEIEPGKRVVGLKNVTINEPYFQGHFPETPIMPGVLIVEAMAQAGGMLAYLSQTAKTPGSLIFFTGIDKVRFRKPVIPGDQLRLEMDLLKQRSGMVKIAGKAMVEDTLVAEAVLMASIGVTL